MIGEPSVLAPTVEAMAAVPMLMITEVRTPAIQTGKASMVPIVLCEGGGDIRVAARITELVSALLDLPSNRICVEQRKG